MSISHQSIASAKQRAMDSRERCILRKNCLRLTLLLIVLLSSVGMGLTVSVGHVHAQSRAFTVPNKPLQPPTMCQYDLCDGLNPATTMAFGTNLFCTDTQHVVQDKTVWDSTGVKAGILRLYVSYGCSAAWAAFLEDCSYPHGTIGYLRNVQLSSDDERSGQQEGPGYQTVTPCHWAGPDVMQGIDCFNESVEDFYAHGSFHDYRGVVIVTNSATFSVGGCQ